MKPRLVFMGTPEEAVPTLQMVHHVLGVALVVTQPDRPRGRSSRLEPPPVKTAAFDLGIQVAQPESRAELEAVVAEEFDLGVVVAYGRILNRRMLSCFRFGLLNLHFSLLPRWRGAAPVNRAIMAGDLMSGVTIIRIDEGLDTGPVLTSQALDIGSGETAGELTDRLARIGSSLIAKTIPNYLSGEIEPQEQSDEGATYAPKLVAADRILDSDAQVEFINRVRGLAPTPGAQLIIDGELVKILAATPIEATVDPGHWEAVSGWPVVHTPTGGVRLDKLQSPGRRLTAGDEWIRGRRADSGRVGNPNPGG